MKKLRSLADTLTASVAQLGADPSRLSVFVDEGGVTVRPGSLSFEYAYTASIWVQDYAGDVDYLLVPVIAWVAQHQVDLFQSGDSQPFTFEAEVLDANTCDITIKIELTERVVVAAQADGLHVEHLEDRPAVDAFDDVPAGVRLWQGIADDLVAGSASIVA